MIVKTKPADERALRERLDAFERKYGKPSAEFIEAFRNGRLRETPDFREWSHVYGAWQLLSTARD